MTASTPPDPADVPLIRLAGAAGLAIAAGYVVIIALYASVGATVPSGGDGAAWLEFLDGRAGAWWGITALSVATDLLYLPVAAGLYVAMRRSDQTLALAGAALLALFVVLDLAITWPTYAGLIALANDDATPLVGPLREASLGAATYAAAVLSSPLFGAYVLAVPGLGIAAFGIAMVRSGFSRVAGWIGVLTGILAVAAVVGPSIASGLGGLAILASTLTLLWFAISGARMVRAA